MSFFIKRFLICITIITGIVYLPSCLVYIVSPAVWWPLGILGIGFPYTWFALLALFACWIFIQKKVAMVLFIGLIIGWPVMKNILPLHKSSSFQLKKDPTKLRLLQWNCQGFPGSFFDYPDLVAERGKAVAFLKKYQPDVLCLSEFTTSDSKFSWSNVSLLQDSLGYKYMVFHPYFVDEQSYGTTYHGSAIFSKYPIVDSGYISYPGKRIPEDIIKADISFNGQSIRVMNTHLSSMHLNHIRIPGSLQQNMVEDSSIIFYGNKIQKIKYFQRYHVSQAELVKAVVDTCSTPLILAGDFNSVPSSFVYKKLRGKLSDAFLERGSGLGRSFHNRQPALRIDYVFHSDEIAVQQWNIFRVSFSDHDPAIMDLIVR
jgi:endonuclease/exonuclease/phosphatase family metal-dependent hydrolase